MKTVTLDVPDISCGHCVETVQRTLAQLTGVQDVQVDLQARRVTVVGQTSPELLAVALDAVGFPAQPVPG